MFIHTVYFNLTDDARQNPDAFVDGLRKMAVIEDLRQFVIASPAGTDRPVMDNDYDYSLHTAFDDSPAHDRYQAHPIHLQFIEDCAQYWTRVRVFDSVTG